MQTKVIDKIVLSESAPSNKNVAWLKPSTEGGGLSLKVYKDQEWSKVETTSSSEGGGGGGSTPDTPSGDGDWHYFDVSGLEGAQKLQVLQIALMYKVKGENIENSLGAAYVVMPVGFGYVMPVVVEEIKAIGTDYSTEIGMGGQSATIEQSIITSPWYGQVPEITKEQFYSLE